MAIQKAGFYYNQQLTRYVVQFMAVFTGLQVQIGKSLDSAERLIDVPIHYGHVDRVVASIIAQNTQNTPIRLPTLSAYVSNLKLAEDRMKGTGTERRLAYVPTGGLIPDDIKVIHQRMPVPYNLEMSLYIYVSNTNQHFQILEQILPLFDPQLQIQSSDSPFDWTKLTHVKLTNVELETNFPIGADRRIIQSTLTFELPIWIDTPADIRRDIVEQIYLRIGAINYDTTSNYDIIAELDQQGYQYNLVATDENLPFS